MLKDIDVLVIGGGPAGLSAACAAYDAGAKNILILERDKKLGGILNQCIHNGFGLHTFKEELTGPEYAQRYIDMVLERKIPYLTDTMVLNIEGKNVQAVNPEYGFMNLKPKSIILTCGCRERPRGAINIAGARPAGIYSAGTAQKYVNVFGYTVGKKAVILGSGDIGLIMARRMVFEGAKVEAVVELMPHSSGLNRNIVQCLNDFDIPLMLSHTITEIHGKTRLEGVTISKVDENLKPIKGTEKRIDCDTLLLSVGLLPENELSKTANIELSLVTGGPIVDNNMMTSVDGIFASGNMLHVHDLVDFVSEESALAGKNAAEYVAAKSIKKQKSDAAAKNLFSVENGLGVRYVVPQKIDANQNLESLALKFRVDKVYRDVKVVVKSGTEVLSAKKKRNLAPGEMETVQLDKKMLDLIKGNKNLKVELEV